MRAMAGPGIAVAVRHECIDFWLGKGIPRLDRRPTGETVQHLLNHQAAVTPSGIEGCQAVNYFADDLSSRCPANKSGLGLNDHGAAAE